MFSDTLNFHSTFDCKHTQITLQRHRLSGTLSVRKNCLSVGIWLLQSFRFAHQHVWHSRKQENQSFWLSSCRKEFQITTSVTISSYSQPMASSAAAKTLLTYGWKGNLCPIKNRQIPNSEGRNHAGFITPRQISPGISQTTSSLTPEIPQQTDLCLQGSPWQTATFSQHTNTHSKAWFC